LAEKTLEVIFSEVPCKRSRLDARKAAKLARRDLEQIREVMLLQASEYRAHVPVGFRSVAEVSIRSLKEQRHSRRRDRGSESVIQQIALEHRRRYGIDNHRGASAAGRMQVNHKRVRIMRKDNLLGPTTEVLQGHHELEPKFEIYLN